MSKILSLLSELFSTTTLSVAKSAISTQLSLYYQHLTNNSLDVFTVPDATPRYAVLLPVSNFSPKLLKSLSYKITYYSRGLRLRLRLNDNWLAEAGFCTDTLVSVPVEHGQLVIRPATKWLIKLKILPNYGRNFYYTLMKATF
ncbi:SymE family type I addiction module toxin [Klebsiella sp. CN_Kp073]|uniref:SymE family type I addiction module toxin n=1 Tax=Klebsiella sp. CN_Kp073 TaxID=3153412 RepID=UPI0032B59D49